MIDLNNMTAEQRRVLAAQIKEQERAEKAQHEADVQAYKDTVDETVKNAFPRLSGIAKKLATNKSEIRGMFDTALQLKEALYGIKSGQLSHTFMDKDGQFRITLGNYTMDNYDDTVHEGIAKVKEFIASLAKDEDSSMLVDAVTKLLAKDQKGNLKASRVLQLQQMAERSGNESFLEGVKIIRDAYKPIESKSYIRAEYKDETGKWVNLPLGMTEA